MPVSSVANAAVPGAGSDARLRRSIAGIGQHHSLRFGVEKQALAVHGDAIGVRKQAQRARVGG